MQSRSQSAVEGRTDACPECGGRMANRREAVCADCGLVVEESRIDRRPRRGRPRNRDGGRETGPPLSRLQPGRRLSGHIGRPYRDGKGNPIGEEKRRRLRRQRIHHQRAVREAHKQTLQPGLTEISRVSTALHAGTDVRETASVLFRRALGEHLLYGRAYESIAGASVYLGTRLAGVIRTLAEVQTVSRCPEGHVARDVRYLQRELDLAVEPPEAAARLSRIRSALDCDESTARKARRLLKTAREANLHSGRDPQGLAAGALYTVSLLPSSRTYLCQVEVGQTAGVSPETVRARYRELRPLCPDVFDISEAEIESPSARAGQRRDRTE